MPGRCSPRAEIDAAAMDDMGDIAYDEGPELQAEITFAGPDRLIGLAALLEPDGGMPGDNPEERLLASLLALLAFHAEGHSRRRGPFARHITRLLAWLKQADLSTLSEEQRDIVTRVLDAIDAKRPVPGFDTEVAADVILNRGLTPEEVWAHIMEVMGEEASDTP